MNKQAVVLSTSLEETLREVVSQYVFDKLFILTDTHTAALCLPRISMLPALSGYTEISIAAGDVHKTLDTLATVWQKLSDGGATRHSLLINLGGGMVTDLGGFAAATFKRGMQYINIPTTLLAMVDASVGGKTGINFNGLKNEVGVFAPANTVILYAGFLESLDRENFFSGYAEMLKHGLISNNEHFNELLSFDADAINYTALGKLVAHSVRIKEEVVNQDPFERGIRKALNLGHTVGHAFESLALAENRAVLHGYAVAWGLVCELYLSCVKTGFPKEKLRTVVQFVKESYGLFYIECDQYEQLYTFMQHDKKNRAGVVNFTLLKDVGNIVIDQTADKQQIFEMFDFYRECMGI
ncbi:3-dehydroquinate synthase [Bacteroides sp. 214]|uniref:3-dehydroquinate synthase n=1 Tax=Bacteroides sp. 214 TaxID=2302935 RepID=UPI0013D79685|nr:3-dehydroquinate synthase [Bacteroides sp. 214]NDW13621.1 3-dehydroquinate synthase [Bacteroides sp. 214]